MFRLKLIKYLEQPAIRLITTIFFSFALVIGATNVARSAELNVRLGEDFTTLDPAFWQSGADLTMINVLFPKLIEFKSGSDWEYELQAAESIEQVDELTIKFTLKPGLMWTGDYGEVTAEDVKYSYERYIDPDLASPIIGDWLPLKEVEVLDKYNGIIHLKEPFAPIWWSTLPYSSGAIVSKAELMQGMQSSKTAAGAVLITPTLWHPSNGSHFVRRSRPHSVSKTVLASVTTGDRWSPLLLSAGMEHRKNASKIFKFPPHAVPNWQRLRSCRSHESVRCERYVHASTYTGGTKCKATRIQL